MRALGLDELMQQGFMVERLEPRDTQQFRPGTGHAVQAQALEAGGDVIDMVTLLDLAQAVIARHVGLRRLLQRQ